MKMKQKNRSNSESCNKRVVCALCALMCVDEHRCTSACKLGAFWPKKVFNHALKLKNLGANFRYVSVCYMYARSKFL